MSAATTDAFGRLDYLVNNAAIYGGMQIESLLKVDLDYYNRFMAVNVNGALHTTRACYRALQKDGGLNPESPQTARGTACRNPDGTWTAVG